MAQYRIITSANPLILSDGTDTFRYAVRSDNMFLDQTVTSLGFSGVENIDWENLEEINSSGDDSYRHGVRNPSWVTDSTITPLGFSVGGVEDTDWRNEEESNL